MVSLISRNYGGKGSQGEVNTGEGDQVGLELVQINVQGSIETKRGSDGGNNLSNETVQVSEAGGGDAQSLLANVVKSFVIDL